MVIINHLVIETKINSKFLSYWNIPCISTTLDVSNLETSKEVKFEHLKNIFLGLIRLDVLKEDKSRLVKEEQSKNI